MYPNAAGLSLNARQCIILVTMVMIALLCVCTTSNAADAPQPTSLDQGWTSADRQWFYTTAQGSHMLPYTWFMALENGNDSQLLSRSLGSYGYLPNPTGPDQLAVGFVKDEDSTGAWIGMTCAACHTNQIRYGNQLLQIDGAPTNADLLGFLTGVKDALRRNADDPVKFSSFATRIYGAGHFAEKIDLHQKLSRRASDWETFIKNSTPKQGSEWGPARADAFGMIFNRVASIDLGIAANSEPPNAPVSYPFLWDTSWHDKVQWNGSAPNKNPLVRLARNAGEVLGVFGELKLQKPTVLHPFYSSSIKRTNLLHLEERVERLSAPKWPEDKLGAIDLTAAAAGKLIYDAPDRCISCHAYNKPFQRQDVVMTLQSEIGTDPEMARASLERMANTGALAGVRQPPVVGPALKNPDRVFNLVGHSVVGALLDWNLNPFAAPLPAPLTRVPAEGHEAISAALRLGSQRQAPRTDAEATVSTDFKKGLNEFVADRGNMEQMAYKARPLDGIWATAPYLHNGSVSSLYQLLLPAAERDKKIYVGSRVFDPKNVGFISLPGTGFMLDTSKLGNSNAGHEGHACGTDLTPEQRRQLIEYLKTL